MGQRWGIASDGGAEGDAGGVGLKVCVVGEASELGGGDAEVDRGALLIAELGMEGLLARDLYGGTEDVEAAYRRILSAQPWATVFCLPAVQSISLL
eukprot:scaffold23448_cov133-Isochrysis_galbana.AAC.7